MKTGMKHKIMANKSSSPPSVIIIGATSGIGEALTKRYLKAGYQVGITGRRLSRLKSIQKQNLGQVYIKQMDVTLPGQSIIQLNHLISQMGNVDIVIISAGVGFINPDLNPTKEQQTIDTNISGFTALASSAMKYFIQQGQGHLVSISSINALRGSDMAPAYAASKAYISNYMQGLNKKVSRLKLNISLTDVQPGFVATDMAKGDNLFWVCPVDKAAKQIQRAIKNKRRQVYVSQRWRLIAWLMKITPAWLYNKL